MATGLVRWCRTKLFTNYKSFSVVGGSADGSDSELLLRNDAIPCNSSPPPPPSASSSHLRQSESPPPAVNTPVSPTPPATNEEQTNSNPTRQLSFEEFECDVSVAEGGGRRQEFSFTLYGVDGHGRISKDDIAGLVKAIYDTLGSKIQAPSCGQIKVKLTVSPDQRSATHGTPKTATSSQNRNSSCCHVTHVDPCSHANQISSRRTHRRRRAPRHRFQSEQQQQQQQQPARNPSDEDAENIPTNPSKEEELRRRVGPVPHLISPYSNSSEGDVSEASDISPTLTPLTPLVSNHRKRSAAMQRQQLFEIIQANMEKNNLGVNNSRKHHEQIPIRSPYAEPPSPYSHQPQQQQQQQQQRYQHHRHSSNYHKPNREPVFTSSKVPVNKSKKNSGKARGSNAPRNTPVNSPKSNVHSQIQAQVLQQNAATRHVAQVAQQIINKNNVFAHVNNNLKNDIQHIQTPLTGKGSKKHQLKHATREQDQARAMAQVVRWLEREFSQNSVAAAAAAAASGQKHVHEHIHHHYHHYHAEALV
ncbi:protein naked cuticle homolog isoform X2 [Leptopilina boulardi]|uniref:protein naked cuticle homolog isoform X2 n=1 Tax=Leptopilina boulardi TaxID=63433 RepID=UPI0021F53557|nr:protein naked cuticle homolog isoform X2 [Leptopilina boulardi]XP_051167126.1 protein naked cuticle homolog isoform X2 [Leptopilina boulardi]XP_051167127.1 protein naked cuticle homolog isoform X2 [Leptopilina boulardi]XP_051167128.1 protein naked cuticle homolog isoform X2 [Leptopilina boulardi]